MQVDTLTDGLIVRCEIKVLSIEQEFDIKEARVVEEVDPQSGQKGKHPYTSFKRWMGRRNDSFSCFDSRVNTGSSMCVLGGFADERRMYHVMISVFLPLSRPQNLFKVFVTTDPNRSAFANSVLMVILVFCRCRRVHSNKMARVFAVNCRNARRNSWRSKRSWIDWKALVPTTRTTPELLKNYIQVIIARRSTSDGHSRYRSSAPPRPAKWHLRNFFTSRSKSSSLSYGGKIIISLLRDDSRGIIFLFIFKISDAAWFTCDWGALSTGSLITECGDF